MIAALPRDAHVLRAGVTIITANRLVGATAVGDLLRIARIVRAQVVVVTRDVVGDVDASTAIAAILRTRDPVIAVVIGRGGRALIHLRWQSVDGRHSVIADRIDSLEGVSRLTPDVRSLDRRGCASITASTGE